MPNQDQSRDGTQRKDEKNQERPSAGEQKVRGLNSDEQPDLVAPSGVNQRDHGAADDKPAGGGALNFDDGDMAHPYGKTTSAGRTRDEKFPSDAGDLGSPNVGMSDRNGPSDPDAKRSK